MKIAYGDLSSTIRNHRVSCGFGLRELAGLVGISPAYLSRIETGKELAVSEAVLNSFAAHLGLNADELCALSGRVPLDVMTLLVDTPGAIARVRRLLKPKGAA